MASSTPQQIYDWVNQPGGNPPARWQQLTPSQRALYVRQKTWVQSANQRLYTVGYYDNNGGWVVFQQLRGADYADLHQRRHLWYLARLGPYGQQLLWIDDASPKSDWRWVGEEVPPQALPPAPPLSGQVQDLEPPPVASVPPPESVAGPGVSAGWLVGLGVTALMLGGVILLLSQRQSQRYNEMLLKQTDDEIEYRENRIREIRAELRSGGLSRDRQLTLKQELDEHRRELKEFGPVGIPA